MEVNAGESNLGCSLVEITDLDGRIDSQVKRREKSSWGNFYEETYDYKSVNIHEDADGYKHLRKWVLDAAEGATHGYGGLAVFCDTSYGGGHKLAKLLRDNGEHVEQTESYKNPRHTGRCTLWVWYFRKRPNVKSKRSTVLRSVSGTGRQKAKQKGAQAA